eukprot:6414427-Amphidinium_carterae.1
MSSSYAALLALPLQISKAKRKGHRFPSLNLHCEMRYVRVAANLAWPHSIWNPCGWCLAHFMQEDCCTGGAESEAACCLESSYDRCAKVRDVSNGKLSNDRVGSSEVLGSCRQHNRPQGTAMLGRFTESIQELSRSCTTRSAMCNQAQVSLAPGKLSAGSFHADPGTAGRSHQLF